MALAVARGTPPFIDLSHEAYRDSGRLVAAVKGICEKCLEARGGIDALAGVVLRRLRTVKEVHIELEVTTTAVTMCCEKTWDINSLFKNDIGFMSTKQLFPYLADPKLPNAKLCDKCLEHPKVQLALLGNIDL